MRVFISWSGERSKAVASALRVWLGDVLQTVEPWMSSSDIESGARWGAELAASLEDIQFGILCLTRENLAAPWILFEAGALSKVVGRARVCPYLLDVSPTDYSGPLTQFQAVGVDREGTWSIVRDLNASLGTLGLRESQLDKAFKTWWPQLAEALKSVPASDIPDRPERTTDEKVNEMLQLLRDISQRPKTSAVIDEAYRQRKRDPLLAELLTETLDKARIDMSHYSVVDQARISEALKRAKAEHDGDQTFRVSISDAQRELLASRKQMNDGNPNEGIEEK